LHLLSIGTGEVDRSINYADAANYKTLRQVAFFSDIKDGGCGRRQSTATFIGAAEEFSKNTPNMSFQHIDCIIPESIDKLDGVKYINDYIVCGLKMRQKIDWDKLRQD
jgi:hypothetical protein